MLPKVKLQWRRNAEDSLALWVYECDRWLPYRQANYYKQDAVISSNNGFATAQEYIKLSKQNKIELEYLPTSAN